MDTTTQGTWASPTQTYGAEGYRIPSTGGTLASLPAWATLTLNGANVHEWATITTDVRALQKPLGFTSRLAS